MKTYLFVLFTCMQSVCFATSQVPGLTAVFDNKKNNVSVKWQHIGDDVEQYELQRSENNFTWLPIYKAEGDAFKKNKMVKFIDHNAGIGKSYYRLRVIRANKSVSTSAPIMVIIGKPGNSWIMFPVPATTVLNLQYNGTERIPGIITVFLRGINGQVFNKLRMASTTRLIKIPIDNLGRGTYDVQIIVGNETVFSQRFVK